MPSFHRSVAVSWTIEGTLPNVTAVVCPGFSASRW